MGAVGTAGAPGVGGTVDAVGAAGAGAGGGGALTAFSGEDGEVSACDMVRNLTEEVIVVSSISKRLGRGEGERCKSVASTTPVDSPRDMPTDRVKDMRINNAH